MYNLVFNYMLDSLTKRNWLNEIQLCINTYMISID